MKQRCNDEYWEYMASMKPTDAPCGRVFDDAEQLTYCPHDPIGGRLVCKETDLYISVCPHCNPNKQGESNE